METLEKNKEILRMIGLSKTSIEVYLDLIKNEKSTAAEIAERTNIYRPNVYDALNNLKSKHLLITTKKDGKVKYTLSNPEQILEEHKKKSFELQDFVSHLKKVKTTEEKNPKISISEGEASFSEAILEALKEKKELLIYGYSAEMRNSISEEARKELMDDRIKKGILVRCLAHNLPEDLLKKFNELPKTKAKNIKGIGSNSSSKFMKIICGNKLFLTIKAENMITLKIEDKEVAENDKQFFEIIWNM